MSAPKYLAADFLAAMQALLPRGLAWPRDPDALMSQAMAGLTPVYERLTARANNLLVDGYPPTTVELLPDWESSLGLPDPCAGLSPSVQARRSQVVARFSGVGGQTAAYFIAFAQSLGYAVTVGNYAPFRMGQSTAGQQLGDQSWFFTFSINAPLNTVTPFRLGASGCGEALNVWGNAVLQCEMQSVAPAHTVLQFHYT